jgi:putative ABC transport system substrate-binding protein
VRRRDLLVLLSTACFLLPLPVRAQQSTQIRRLGVLLNLSENDQEVQRLVTVFREELTRSGWVDGHNLRVDYRWTNGDVDRARAFAKEIRIN